MIHATAYWRIVLESGLRRSHHTAVIVRWHRCAVHAIAIVHLLVLAFPAAFLLCLFLEKRSNAHTASFGSEVASERVGACEPPPAAPATVVLEHTTADKFLLSRVKTLVTLAVVLAGERFTAHAAHKRTLVCVGAQVRPEIVGTSETLWTQSALEGCGVLLCALGARAISDLGGS